MITKTQLYALDLSSFYTTCNDLDSMLRANQERLDDIAHVKDLVASNMQGLSAIALLAKLASIEAQVNSHITLIVQAENLITAYCDNKTRLQGEVIDFIENIERDGFTVSDTWQIRPSNTLLQSLAPALVWVHFKRAALLQPALKGRVTSFEYYDFQAALIGDPGPAPYITSGGYTTVQPDRTMTWDDDFPWGSKRGQATPADYRSWELWKHGPAAARLMGQPDAARCYQHFLDNTGTPLTIDYEKGYEEDRGIRYHVNTELNGALQAANEAAQAGQTGITLHSPGSSTGETHTYPETTNWQRTLGDHNTYTETKVEVNGDTVTATVTVHARDKWNFNKGDSDIASGAPDAANGRFEELGWARSFETNGSMTRTYSWKVGQQPPVLPTNADEDTSSRRR